MPKQMKRKSRRMRPRFTNDSLPGNVVLGQHRYCTFHGDKGKAEEKYANYSNPQVTFNSSGVMTLLNGCIQGTDAINDRIGRKIVNTSVRIEGIVQNSVANLNVAGTFFAGSDTIKVALVYDKQTNQAAPAYADVYNTSGAVNAPLAMRNVNYEDRFMILWEKILTICSTESTIKSFAVSLPVDLESRFGNSNNGNSTDFASGAIYLAFADANVAGTGQTEISFVSSVTFQDE